MFPVYRMNAQECIPRTSSTMRPLPVEALDRAPDCVLGVALVAVDPRP